MRPCAMKATQTAKPSSRSANVAITAAVAQRGRGTADTILVAQDGALDQQPARGRGHQRQAEHEHEDGERPRVAYPVEPAPGLQLRDPQVVPEEDAVRDRAEEHREAAVEYP